MTPRRDGAPDDDGDDAPRGLLPGALDRRVLAVMLGDRRPFGAAELAERVGEPVRSVQRALGKLVREREVRRAGGGMFAVSRHRSG